LTLDGARAWTAEFVCLCNVEHRSSGIRKLIPALVCMFALIEKSDSSKMLGARELTSGSAWGDCLRTHAQRLHSGSNARDGSGHGIADKDQRLQAD
jgi:hypothetical protein